MRRLAVLVLAACSGEDPQTVCSGFVGDPAAAPEIELIYLGVDEAPTALEEGGRLPLIEAPQGGKHIFAGVRARNLDTCPISLTGVLRDPATGRVRFEARPVSFLAAEDGWAYARERNQISSYANIPACPNIWSSQDIYEEAYELELTARDRAGRMATRSVTITPFCGQPELEENCLCTCRQGYSGTCP